MNCRRGCWWLRVGCWSLTGPVTRHTISAAVGPRLNIRRGLPRHRDVKSASVVGEQPVGDQRVGDGAVPAQAPPLDFESFVALRGAALMRLAVLLTGSQQDAEDLWQDTFAHAFRVWPKVQRADHPQAYVRRMMVNQHTSSRRRFWHRERPTDSALLVGPQVPDPGERVVGDDALWQTLAQLAPRTRTVLVLRYFEDLDDRAIAELLDCSRGTVASTASRGLDALRAKGEPS